MNIQFVYTTWPDAVAAREAARLLVKSHLAACVNILGAIDSVYIWDGAIQEGSEVAMIVKTTAERVSEVIDKVLAIHSDECPCVVSLPVVKGYRPFLEWVSDTVE